MNNFPSAVDALEFLSESFKGQDGRADRVAAIASIARRLTDLIDREEKYRRASLDLVILVCETRAALLFRDEDLEQFRRICALLGVDSTMGVNGGGG